MTSDTPALSPIGALGQSPPRPSVDAHSHPSAPFLHNLTQRLRKGSNASSHSSDHSTPHAPPPPDPVTKTESSRATRRMLFSLIKDDWEYPSTTVRHNDTGLLPREPIGYRRREESQSDIEAEEMIIRRGLRSKSDPYKFENPDAVGNFVAERLRKRRRLLEEEMQWNEGLRTWAQRRDAWTGAVKHNPSLDQADHTQRPNVGSHANTWSSSSSAKRLRHKSRLSQSMTHERNTSNSPTDSPLSPCSNATSHSSSSPESSSVGSNTETTSGGGGGGGANATEPAGGPWLPIFPPILPAEDTLRDRIKPQAYPTIYSKVVVQSMTPNVPIPLKHLIPALVVGWKSEGSWPPQPASISAQDVKKGRRSSAFAKWRREHHFDTKAAEHTAGANDDGKSRVRRSIGMMRKVLGGVHADANANGGLDDLGIEFREQDEDEMQKNVTLNKSLLGVDNGHDRGHEHEHEHEHGHGRGHDHEDT
ncbi:hypothetical protein A1O3_06274 [Capronia epimyces CBS 606.96]|uniref:Gag1-like clamp domain-containing protein n=1 Tax=Capronia epimyces CBS 606.96 TaxID=1182542 RepID=W9XZR6_9EURO|nr:uncharacterized protein A1O3_06274 [Capronia epimyces CBS 606.96]EXJ82461.1 hypothetical protein A1O3_06274 [Capronia epimyces CBS 606.96]